jgi:Lar family restriction alleviation protein
MDKQELKNCPFCGTPTAKVFQADPPYNDWFVKCTKCNNSMPLTNATVHSKAEAVAAWNLRSTEDALHERIDALEVLLYGETGSGLTDILSPDRAYAIVQYHMQKIQGLNRSHFPSHICVLVFKSTFYLWEIGNSNLHRSRYTIVK